MTDITAHFTLEELTHTDTGLENNPPTICAANLVRLCELALEPARELVGALYVNSGYRSPAVNAAVGGAKTSAHMDGRAADVKPLKVSINVLFDLVAASEIPYDQLILELTWVHIGIAKAGEQPRRQKLKAHRTEAGAMVYEHVQ